MGIITTAEACLSLVHLKRLLNVLLKLPLLDALVEGRFLSATAQASKMSVAQMEYAVLSARSCHREGREHCGT